MSIDKNLPYEEVCEKVAAFLKSEPALLSESSSRWAAGDFEARVKVSSEIANLMMDRGLIKSEESSMRAFTDAVGLAVKNLKIKNTSPNG